LSLKLAIPKCHFQFSVFTISFTCTPITISTTNIHTVPFFTKIYHTIARWRPKTFPLYAASRISILFRQSCHNFPTPIAAFFAFCGLLPAYNHTTLYSSTQFDQEYFIICMLFNLLSLCNFYAAKLENSGFMAKNKRERKRAEMGLILRG